MKVALEFVETHIAEVDFVTLCLDLEGPYPNEESIVDRILEMNAQVGPIYRNLGEDEQAAARQALIDGLDALRQVDGTYVLPSQMWGVHAR